MNVVKCDCRGHCVITPFLSQEYDVFDIIEEIESNKRVKLLKNDQEDVDIFNVEKATKDVKIERMNEDYIYLTGDL